MYIERNYEYITINGLSMQPTINPYPVVIENKNLQDGVYMKKNEPVSYGDIVIIDKRDELGKTIIKRLLGKGGDKISILKMNIDGQDQYRFLRIKSGTSIIEVVEENYICGKCKGGELNYSVWLQYKRTEPKEDLFGNYYEKLFYEEYFQNSLISDSNIFLRDFVYQGLEYTNVKFYELDQGKIFYMGDNRINSSDARQDGPEDESKILGKVVTIMHNSTSSKNSIFYYFHRIWGYFDVIWQEIIKNFAWKA